MTIPIQQQLSLLSDRQRRLFSRALRGDSAARLWLDPVGKGLMVNPDPWQRELQVEVLTHEQNAICDCSRQSGKTEVAASLGYAIGCLGEFAMIVSPSDRQSLEHMAVVQEHHNRLKVGQMQADPTKHEMTFANGGRILALPNSPSKIRGFRKVRLLIIEEAAFVPDEVYNAIRPVLAVGGGQTLLISTPNGQQGFFYEEWLKSNWCKHRISWRDVGNHADGRMRLTPEWIEAERKKPGVNVIQEYLDCAPGEEFQVAQYSFFGNVDRGWGALYEGN